MHISSKPGVSTADFTQPVLKYSHACQKLAASLRNTTNCNQSPELFVLTRRLETGIHAISKKSDIKVLKKDVHEIKNILKKDLAHINSLRNVEKKTAVDNHKKSANPLSPLTIVNHLKALIE